MDIRIVNPIDYPKWNEQIEKLPGSTFFYSEAWAKVLAASYGYKPFYFVALEGSTISACLPIMEVDSFLTGRRGVSLPFTDYCHLLVSENSQFKDLLNAAADYGRKRGWKALELRGGSESLNGTPSSSSYLFHTLNLRRGDDPRSCHSTTPDLSSSLSQSTNQNPLFASFRESTKRNIRKASGSGVDVRILASEESVRQFYRLNQVTRRDHGLPPQPYRFFEEVYDHVISKGNGFVAVAFHQARPIAAAVYFHFGETAVYKYGASDKAFQRLRPNNLIMWEAINWYTARNYKALSLGRTDLDHDGLRQFKMGWGVTEEPLPYYRYSMKTSAFVGNDVGKTNGLGFRAVSIVPLPVLRAIGSLLYRHMG